MDARESCLPDLLINQAKKTPDALAIVCGHERISYWELDQATDSLGAYLRHQGISLDDPVGIFMETCSEYVVASIGTLKAGAAFMPIALDSPDDLLTSIIAEARPKVIATKAQYVSRLTPLSSSAQILSLDSDQSWRHFKPETNGPDITRDNLAFVPYTSGTTGDPKGVMQTHGAVISSYLGRYKFSSYQVGDRVACNIFFVWEFLRPLLRGGTVYIIPDEVIFLPRTLTAFISEHQISEILFTPSLFQAVLNSADRESLRRELASLGVVWLNGEVVPSRLLGQAIDVLSGSTRLFNTYSISETHDVCTVDLRDLHLDGGDLSPVGLPMDGVTVKVLAEGGSSLTSTGSGELHIGGHGLARGYLERPDLNQQKFVYLQGEKYYATGDLAEIDGRGMVTVIGRSDSMVKIRGYSVQLGAVEEILRKHCDVIDAAVSVDVEDLISKRLVAYVVRGSGATWRIDARSGTSRDLRNRLERYLPHYMVPSRFLELEELPINQQTGKLDRKSLPAFRKIEPVGRDRVIGLKGSTLAQRRSVLRELWSEELDVEIGCLKDDWNFFDLGGHSLAGLGLTLGMEHAFGIKLQGTEIYEHPTIDKLATYLGDRESHMESKFSITDDARLEPDVIPPEGVRIVGLSQASSIFFTGATGFLGPFLLNELLRSTSSNTKFYCLVRGRDSGEDQESNRVLETLKFYELPGQFLQERIVPIIGDLTNPQFGLGDEEYRQLSEEVDLIFHCAASVNYVYPYPAIKPHTVDGTLAVIKFACNAKAKPVQYISSNGIFPGGDDVPYLENSQIESFAERMEGGYNQAKWVAERLVWSAASRGLPVCIFRPGNIGHHSVTGIVNPNDFQTLIIKACLRSGFAPLAPNWLFEMTPVDFLAAAITKIADDPTHLGNVYNVVEPNPVAADQVFTFMESNGYVSNRIPLSEWRKKLNEMAEADNDRELKVLVQSLDAVESYLTDTSVYDTSRFNETLIQLGLTAPPVDVDYVTKIFRTS